MSFHFNDGDSKPTGGAACLVLLPPSLIKRISICLHTACSASSKSDEGAKMPHDGSRPAFNGHFGGNLIRVLKTLTLRVGAARLQGLMPLKSDTPPQRAPLK